MGYLIPVLILGSLGLLFGIGLSLASKKLAVQVDPRLEKLHGLLPGANCGACGGAGCFGFAQDLLSGKRNLSACQVAEEAVKRQIAKLLGKDLETEVKKVATLHCFGGLKVKDRFLYDGIKDCVAANLVLGGQKACVFGCLGFGDCVRVCPFDAIKMSDEGLPLVDEEKCKACNKCVLVCSKKLFSLVPVDPVRDFDVTSKLGGVSNGVYVACSSKDIGRDTRLVCPVGCIACCKCEQICPVDAIHVVDGSTTLTINPEQSRGIDNLAIIDYNKCTSCGKCVEVCPMKTIRVRSQEI